MMGSCNACKLSNSDCDPTGRIEDGNGRLRRAIFDLALAQGATFHSERTSRLWAVSPVAHFWTRNRDTALSPRQRRLLEMAVAPDDPEDGWLTAKRAARQTRVQRVTASRDLARMEELGVIEKDPSMGGRSTRYRVRLADKEPLRLVDELKWK